MSVGDTLLAHAIASVRDTWNSPEHGIVGAAAKTIDGRIISATSHMTEPGKFVHAERVVVRKLREKGVALAKGPGPNFACTLVPCAKFSSSRIGSSCMELLLDCGVKQIFVGAADSIQPKPSFYLQSGLEVIFSKHRQLRASCIGLAKIFERFGSAVNSDILGIKNEVGISVLPAIETYLLRGESSSEGA